MEDDFVSVPPAAPDVADDQWDSVERSDAVEYDPETDTYRTSFDSKTGSVSMAVVTTVAVVAETNPRELPPLHSVIDADALDTLVEQSVSRSSESDIHVSFTFDGYAVTVHSYGIVAVRPPEADGND